MDEAIVADIDSDVGKAPSFLIEEQQIPGPYPPPRDPSRGSVLGAGASRHPQAGKMVAVLHEAAAIETLPRPVSTVAVRDTDEFRGECCRSGTIGIGANRACGMV